MRCYVANTWKEKLHVRPRALFISTILMPYLLKVKVPLIIFLDFPSFHNLGMRFLLAGRVITPRVIEIINQFLNPQLSPKARNNQVTKF
jgi:hypothetical protein